jgi:hypothetical protein
MKLVTYRSFRPLQEFTPKMNDFYGRKGITESFLRDIQFCGPHELGWILAARNVVGRRLADKLRAALRKEDPGIEIEERSKRLRRIAEKLCRGNRMPGGLEAPDYARKLLRLAGVDAELHSIGSVKDWYGIRLITACTPDSRDKCYALLEKVFEVAGITDISQVAALVDYLSYRQLRFAESGEYLGRYESLHLSFIYQGIPIEVQIRDSEMDRNAKLRVKRAGLD